LKKAPNLKLIEGNKKALIIGDRGFLQYDVQRHRQQNGGYSCKVFSMSFEMMAKYVYTRPPPCCLIFSCLLCITSLTQKQDSFSGK
jgi:hypothetical protein